MSDDELKILMDVPVSDPMPDRHVFRLYHSQDFGSVLGSLADRKYMVSHRTFIEVTILRHPESEKPKSP